MDDQKQEWEMSYLNRDNFVFYPHEEVIRFVSRFIRKRTGLKEFENIASGPSGRKILDLGCGIGRHVVYCHEMGLDAYGIDLSSEAVKVAREWVLEKGDKGAEHKIVEGDIRQMPWPSGHFDYVISHGVLDSMHFSIAQGACREVARILRPHGLFYCDLVSGDDSNHAREFAGEEIVSTAHEQGTVQSYFNYSKINQLIESNFKITEAKLIRQENLLTGIFTSRYHLVLERN